MLLVNILSNEISFQDFAIIGSAWTLGCLIPCIDVPFFLNAKHKIRQIKRILKKPKTKIKKRKKLKIELQKINANRNRYFHTVTMMLVCSVIVIYLITYQSSIIEKVIPIPINYYYWAICFAFPMGYALHLILDCIGASPIPMFILFVKDPYDIPIRIKRTSKTMKGITIFITVVFIITFIKTTQIITK